MVKRRDRIIYYIWLFLTVAVRLLYYLLDYKGVKDSFGFYDSGMIRLEEGEKVLSSGMGFAYTNAVSKILGLFGNDIHVIFVWQLVLETIALSLIFWGCRIIWSMPSTIAMMAVMTFSPINVESVRVCSPEQYFLFHFSIIFFVMALFYRHTRLHGWFKSSLGQIILLLMGFYSGVLLAWNYMGFFALVIMIYIAFNNYRINDDKNRILIMTEKELEEKDQMMNGFGQVFLVLVGTVLGLFVTLMKYTGYTGYTIVEQFVWWYNLLKKLPGRTMDFASDFAVNFLLAFVLCLIVNIFYLFREEKLEVKHQAELEAIRLLELAGEDNAFTTKKRVLGVDYFVTEDGREVDYLQNPLPIPPKKHDRVSPKFNVEAIAKENAEAIMNSENLVERVSDGMAKAAIGIENVVKLKSNDKVEPFEREAASSAGTDENSKKSTGKESFEPIIDILNLDKKDDFDIDIAPGDDFDI